MISFPVYLLLDVSSSMSGGPIASLNDNIFEIRQHMLLDPLLADSALLSVISFANDARVEVPLSHPLEVHAPLMHARGVTNYAPALRLLRSTISEDVQALKMQGSQVYRPVAFFLTDGYPTDSASAWGAELDRLRATRTRPTLIAVGIGEVDPAVLYRLASEKGQVYISSPGRTSVEAISGFKDLVFGTLDSLASSQASGRPRYQIPRVEGFDVPPDDFFI